jgi:hypothetical protein
MNFDKVIQIVQFSQDIIWSFLCMLGLLYVIDVSYKAIRKYIKDRKKKNQ